MEYIYGCGGHAKVIVDVLMDRGLASSGKHYEKLRFVDDYRTGEFLGAPIVKPNEVPAKAWMYLAIGDNRARERVFMERTAPISAYDGAFFPFLMAKSAVQAGTPGAPVFIGKGVHILNQTYIGPDCRIGHFTIVNNGATVDHDCHLEPFVHIAPGVHLCGNVKVGRGTLVGAGSVVIPGVSIGQNCIIGAGSVVVSDIPDNSKAYGNPCKVIADIGKYF